MDAKDFIEKFAEAVEVDDPSTLSLDTKFRELDEWSSLAALSTLAMVDEEYDITLKGDELRSAQTIGELMSLIDSKLE